MALGYPAYVGVGAMIADDADAEGALLRDALESLNDTPPLQVSEFIKQVQISKHGKHMKHPEAYESTYKQT